MCALLASGCATPVPARRPYATVPIRAERHVQTKISAQGEWQDTTVDLRRDDAFFVDARGVWSGGFGWDGGPSGSIGPDGGRIFPEERAATALIGKVGQSMPFTVADQYLGRAPCDGNLYLRMNDVVWGDNWGYLTVDIYVERGQAAQPPAMPAVTAPAAGGGGFF